MWHFMESPESILSWKPKIIETHLDAKSCIQSTNSDTDPWVGCDVGRKNLSMEKRFLGNWPAESDRKLVSSIIAWSWITRNRLRFSNEYFWCRNNANGGFEEGKIQISAPTKLRAQSRNPPTSKRHDTYWSWDKEKKLWDILKITSEAQKHRLQGWIGAKIDRKSTSSLNREQFRADFGLRMDLDSFFSLIQLNRTTESGL